MDETEIQVIRRQRLKAWLEGHGGARHACEKRGLGRTVESHISQILGGYSFGPRAARSMEKKLGMDVGFLEPQIQNTETASLSPIAIELARLFDTLQDRIQRTVAYNAATEAILKVLREPELPPSDTPSPAAKPKKQRA